MANGFLDHPVILVSFFVELNVTKNLQILFCVCDTRHDDNSSGITGHVRESDMERSLKMLSGKLFNFCFKFAATLWAFCHSLDDIVLIKSFTDFNGLTLLVGRQEGHLACEKLKWWGAGVIICLVRGADLHMAHLMPLPLTVSCFSKIQTGFTFLVPADPGSP